MSSEDKVTVILMTSDRTRRASVTVPRRFRVSDIIKASSKRWFLTSRMDYQVCNLTTNRMLLPGDPLNATNVRNNDVLMLQPYAAHGAA